MIGRHGVLGVKKHLPIFVKMGRSDWLDFASCLAFGAEVLAAVWSGQTGLEGIPG